MRSDEPVGARHGEPARCDGGDNGVEAQRGSNDGPSAIRKVERSILWG
jgi:hypothetical protein